MIPFSTKKITGLVAGLFLSASLLAQNYTPSAANLEARKTFQDSKYGMFIHWGLSSTLGDGEWVMNNRNIRKADYQRLLSGFYPAQFDAEKWVLTAKNAGMKYIVFITRHHDSFSNWDTKFSDWKITNTPFKRDVLKELAAACKKEGMKLGLYYSTLDWYREDYPHETGRTGQGTGRKGKGDYASYLQFMKNQLTELLTNYGEIMSIWFDGHWDQTNPEGEHDRSSRIDWKYDEIYNLIHSLQPQCMIGNNHHLSPLPGEDFQMFERDLPGENKSGLSYQKASDEVPLETCETINGAWGYNITDRNYKTVNQVIQLLVGAAGRNANLLLNVGPMPNGQIQPEFTDTLAAAGKWLEAYGETIYGTRGGPVPPQPWGVSTQKGKKIYLHLFKQPFGNMILLPGFKDKVKQVQLFVNRQPLKFKQQAEGLLINTDGLSFDKADEVIEVELK
ncbi:alpha-L-fucosidase [Flavihumibacter sp. CACIAM 22H1]|uniref:alpha-L-fucosidase n=1 Tax=Flavihumibacter sp. CACIAM 22H1 TaxID=1812911 RepID=UPI0007A88FEC|nr:alpha-L-fucosidase [Flavihumibacter sp. CACIAM 22H1]KYP16403.1 MAG: alpha-L-fucosidase [Flavihumibacter sp. CACIAM 22H1]